MARRTTYPGYIRKRGPSWYLTLTVGGERHRYTLRGRREDVEAFARDEDARLRKKARRVTNVTSPPFSEALKHYRTSVLDNPRRKPQGRSLPDYRSVLRGVELFFVDMCGDPRLDRITRVDVKAFRRWRRHHGLDGAELAQPLSDRTVQKATAILSAVFAEAVEEMEWITDNPADGLSGGRGRTESDSEWRSNMEDRLLTDAQLEELLAECESNPMRWMYVLTVAETGARNQSEVLHLRWSDVDLAEGFISIQDSKSAAGVRDVPMSARLLEAMREHAARFRLKTYDGQRSPWVFHHTRNHRKAKAGNRIKSMYKGVRAAAERAELPDDFRMYDLRHRRVSRWAEEHPAFLVSAAAGHADIQTTKRYYVGIRREKLRRLVADSLPTTDPGSAPRAAEARGG